MRRHAIEKKKAVEGNHKPSSVVRFLLFSTNQEMAIYLGPWLPKASSDLTRSAFALGRCPRYKFEWAFLTPPAAESGTYLVLLRVGFTELP